MTNTSMPASEFWIRIATPSGLVFAIIGTVSVIAGGLIAAGSGPLNFAHGSWLGAYLVLVTGVVQTALGIGQDYLAALSTRTTVTELVGINAGSVVIIIGTLTDALSAVSVGSLLLLVGLLTMLVTTRHASASALSVTFRLVIAVVIISIPIGVVLAYLDTGSA